MHRSARGCGPHRSLPPLQAKPWRKMFPSPFSFFFFFSLLYPVYATNKFNFQELE